MAPVCPLLRPIPRWVPWLLRTGILSARWVRLQYYKKPIEWCVTPTPAQRTVVEKTDLWVMKPGQAEKQYYDGRVYLVLRHANYLEPGNDLICVQEQKVGLEMSDYIGIKKSERYVSEPVARFLPERAGILPGQVEPELPQRSEGLA